MATPPEMLTAGSTTKQTQSVISGPDRLAILPTDGELLMLFVNESDEVAFAELIERHGPMVWRVCRGILFKQQDAEDAYQATFLLLARKAKQIRSDDSAAGWLYRVAYRTALSAKRRSRRRREEQLESEPVGQAEEAFPDLMGRQMVAILLEELRSIPKKYQEPLVMRYLEGQSRRKIADQTGSTVAGVQGMLARGKQILRSRLIRRGVSLSVAMGLVSAAHKTAFAAPPRLITQTTASCQALATAGTISATTAAAATLFREGIRSMFLASMTKPMTAVAACSIVLALWLGGPAIGGALTELPTEESVAQFVIDSSVSGEEEAIANAHSTVHLSADAANTTPDVNGAVETQANAPAIKRDEPTDEQLIREIKRFSTDSEMKTSDVKTSMINSLKMATLNASQIEEFWYRTTLGAGEALPTYAAIKRAFKNGKIDYLSENETRLLSQELSLISTIKATEDNYKISLSEAHMWKFYWLNYLTHDEDKEAYQRNRGKHTANAIAAGKPYQEVLDSLEQRANKVLEQLPSEDIRNTLSKALKEKEGSDVFIPKVDPNDAALEAEYKKRQAEGTKLKLRKPHEGGRYRVIHKPSELNEVGWVTIADMKVGNVAPILLPKDQRPRPQLRITNTSQGACIYTTEGPDIKEPGREYAVRFGVPTVMELAGQKIHIGILKAADKSDPLLVVREVSDGKFHSGKDDWELAKELLNDSSRHAPIPKETKSVGTTDSNVSKSMIDEIITPPTYTVQNKPELSINELNQRGWRSFYQGKNQEAEADFREILERDRKHLPALNGLAFSLLNQGNVKEAKPMFEKYLKKDPKASGPLNGLARCLAAEGDVDGAIKLWEKGAKLTPGASAHTSSLAFTYFERGEYAKAIPHFELLVKSAPENVRFSDGLQKAKSALAKEDGKADPTVVSPVNSDSAHAPSEDSSELEKIKELLAKAEQGLKEAEILSDKIYSLYKSDPDWEQQGHNAIARAMLKKVDEILSTTYTYREEIERQIKTLVSKSLDADSTPSSLDQLLKELEPTSKRIAEIEIQVRALFSKSEHPDYYDANAKKEREIAAAKLERARVNNTNRSTDQPEKSPEEHRADSISEVHSLLKEVEDLIEELKQIDSELIKHQKPNNSRNQAEEIVAYNLAEISKLTYAEIRLKLNLVEDILNAQVQNEISANLKHDQPDKDLNLEDLPYDRAYKLRDIAREIMGMHPVQRTKKSE